jgi:hypothetical protein
MQALCGLNCVSPQGFHDISEGFQPRGNPDGFNISGKPGRAGLRTASTCSLILNYSAFRMWV